MLAPHAQAQLLGLDLFNEASGTAPFDVNANCPVDTAGDDCNDTNLIVRTHDTAVVTFNYSVNGGGTADNVTIVSTLPMGVGPQIIAEWNTLPASCTGTGSMISLDKQTLTCNVGSVASGSSLTIKPDIRILGNALNGVGNPGGDILPINGTVSADAPVLPAVSPVLTYTISAAPMLDLRKNGTFRTIGRDGPASQPGALIVYEIEVLTNELRGQENITADMVFTDDVSSIAPSAQLYSLDGEPNCGISGEGDASRSTYNTPYGRIGMFGSATVDNSVVDSGVISCTQAGGPGTAITITISGADTQFTSTPTLHRNGTPTVANEYFAVAGFIAIWVDAADIPGTLNTTNLYSGFDPVSVTGQSNFDTSSEPLANNSRNVFLQLTSGGGGKWYFNDIEAGSGTMVPGQSAFRAGDGYVLPGQTFASRSQTINLGVLSIPDVVMCEKIDNTKYVVLDRDGMPGVAHRIFEGSGSYTVEYGTGGYADIDAQRNATCENADSPDGWFSATNLVPGGLSAITKIRMTGGPIPPSENHYLAVRLQALPGTSGAILPNFFSRLSTVLNSGLWNVGSYDPATHGGNGLGDRLTLTNAITRITKIIPPDDTQT
ncbi:MAG: hypothetical protein HKM24_06820, partial [Gammaproteobacteria bacterium]|nr:hypothetical protein [Gammaproteobacteria bacterium]